MRIRKRYALLGSSTLSPTSLPFPLSDPHRSNVSPFQREVHEKDHKGKHEASSGLHPNPDADLSILQQQKTHLYQPLNSLNQSTQFEEEKETFEEEEGEEDGAENNLRDRDKSKNDSMRKGRQLGAKAAGAVASLLFSSSSCHQQAVGRWCEGEKVFPLKKRRGSFERKVSEETPVEKEKKMKTKMKTKTSKKWLPKVVEEDELNSASSTKKRGSSSGVIMEGSRCSRVNGRGWRCFQQTLVGYSLCEHHLGKGRLRSMNSFRSRALAPKKEEDGLLLSLSSSSMQEENQEQQTVLDENEKERNEKKPLLMVAKKRKRIGTVKARSLSSLLCQTL